MINKKNLLSRTPEELGIKDAIHVAIVSVRAACLIKPGQRVKLNEFREAIPHRNGCGVANPFMREEAMRGDKLWLLLDADEVPNVIHTWDHPTIDFTPPDRDVVQNTVIKEAAKDLGLTYEQLMDVCQTLYEGHDVEYQGILSREQLEEKIDDFYHYDLWSEWSEETGNEFGNQGTECCPEYNFPALVFVESK